MDLAATNGTTTAQELNAALAQATVVWGPQLVAESGAEFSVDSNAGTATFSVGGVCRLLAVSPAAGQPGLVLPCS